MIDMDLVAAHRHRALSPERPKLRGTAQNPDVFFQAREACNPFYDAVRRHRAEDMDKFAKLVRPAVSPVRLRRRRRRRARDRHHGLRHAAWSRRRSTSWWPRGRRSAWSRCGCSAPWTPPPSLAALPKTVKKIAVLDRTKEPGASGEPLYQDVVTALAESWAGSGTARCPQVIGGRYGLSSKEFTPAMVAAVYDELTKAQPKRQFTVGINDDVTNLSLDYDPDFSTERRRRGPGRVLRPGQRRHRERQPQLGEDRRREHAAARPGLFRLRLAEGRLGHHLARPLQPAADQGLVPGAPGEFRGLPPVPLPGADRHALDGRCRGRRSC